ncbi:MAG: hypothetical protein MR639_03450 [Clostridium sp.]|uniref:hypothetical protein n=1 Tax=Clostridium sp. TaxID=1506 RepID=UPI002A846775|nr:hypothetical protein [Clostridium sp.]MDY5098037.1 hypothetical protein [Clostridium sp.]
MKIKKFFHDNYWGITTLFAAALVLSSPTTNIGNTIRYLLFIPVFVIYTVSLYFSLKKDTNAKPLTRIFCKATIVFLVLNILYILYRVYSLIF